MELIPRETVVGAVEDKTKSTGGVEGVGEEIIGRMVEARPNRERGRGATGA